MSILVVLYDEPLNNCGGYYIHYWETKEKILNAIITFINQLYVLKVLAFKCLIMTTIYCAGEDSSQSASC